MEMTFNDIQAVIADSVRLGYMKAVKAFEPTADIIRERELKSWCLANAIDIKTITKMIARGEIKKHRMGVCRNSPTGFSKAEIKQVIASLTLANLKAREL